MKHISKLMVMSWLLFGLILLVPAPVALAQGSVTTPEPTLDINGLVAQLLSLGGVGSLITFLINAFKTVGWVKDGTSPAWLLGFNLVALGLLFFAHLVGFDQIQAADQAASTLAQIGVLVVSLITQFGIGRLAHTIFRGMPLIGTSFTLKAAQQLAA